MYVCPEPSRECPDLRLLPACSDGPFRLEPKWRNSLRVEHGTVSFQALEGLESTLSFDQFGDFLNYPGKWRFP